LIGGWWGGGRKRVSESERERARARERESERKREKEKERKKEKKKKKEPKTERGGVGGGQRTFLTPLLPTGRPGPLLEFDCSIRISGQEAARFGVVVKHFQAMAAHSHHIWVCDGGVASVIQRKIARLLKARAQYKERREGGSPSSSCV
jgi:hypothetical protein